MLNEKDVNKIKAMYPKGTRIKLQHMNDPYHPVPDGTMGTVKHIDDAGQIHMYWDNGSGLALIPEADDFEIVESVPKREDKIRIIIVEPNEHPRMEYINNDLKTMEAIVDGDIQEVSIDDEAVLVCNEEGKLLNLKANRSVGDDIIAGTFFIAADLGYEYLSSLSEEQTRKYVQDFYDIEEHSQEKMFKSFSYSIYGG